MVINRGNGFERVQVKTGTIDDGKIRFPTAGVVQRNNASLKYGKKNYRGKADLFAVYCEALDNVYLVPVEEAGVSNCSLRLATPRNNQVINVRMAEDYLLKVK